MTSQEVYEYLRDNLIEWKPRESRPAKNKVGFDNDNVRNIEVGSLPIDSIFDYVFIAPPIINRQGTTTGAGRNVRITETYTLDVYVQRGTSTDRKIQSLKDMDDTRNLISEMFEKIGFIIMMPQADLNYNDAGIIRQVMNITRTYIK